MITIETLRTNAAKFAKEFANTGLCGDNGTFLHYLHNHTKADGRESKLMSLDSKIKIAAQAILDARLAEQDRCTAQGQKYSLASLYAAGNMPADLLKAHNTLDKAVDAAYGYKETCIIINKHIVPIALRWNA